MPNQLFVVPSYHWEPHPKRCNSKKVNSHTVIKQISQKKRRPLTKLISVSENLKMGNVTLRVPKYLPDIEVK